MAVDQLILEPKTKRAAGERCCEPVVYPDVERQDAERMATVAKALADPIRLQLVDVLRKHAGKVCVCELVPLFDVSQPTISHHLKVLRQAGILASEKRGLWVYAYVVPGALDEFAAWLAASGDPVAQPSAASRPSMATDESGRALLERVLGRTVAERDCVATLRAT